MQAAQQEHGVAAPPRGTACPCAHCYNFEPPPGASPRVLEATVPSLVKDEREWMEFEARTMEPVKRVKRDLEYATEVQERAKARWEEFAFLGERDDWLARVVRSGTKLVHRPAKIGRGELFPDEVARIRREITALYDEWRAVEAAPSSPADYRARAIAEIEDSGRPRCAPGQPERPGPAALGTRASADARKIPVDDRVATTGDAGAALWVWLHKDALIARVSALVAAAPAENAKSEEEREAAFRAIVEKKLSLEFLEEAAICAAANAGHEHPEAPRVRSARGFGGERGVGVGAGAPGRGAPPRAAAFV